MQISYLGHSTLMIESAGVRLITDPVFRRRISIITRTHPIYKPDKIETLDAVLISHLHYDHLDLPSLKEVGPSPQIILPKGGGSILENNQMLNFREIEIGEQFEIGDLRIKVTFAKHDGGRNPISRKTDCLGYLVQGSAQVYYPGDTRLFPEMAAVSDDIDVVLMPVWGWGPNLGPHHMSPREAAHALNLIKPKIAIPIHWGTYLPMGMQHIKPAFHSRPPLDFTHHARELAPEVKVVVLQPGETFTIPEV